jgi:hypothetical protein
VLSLGLRAAARRCAIRIDSLRMEWRHGRLNPVVPSPGPRRRPLELIASDARRLGARLEHPPPGISFAKLEGARWAYEHVLVEACAALGIDHLLQVLPPGEDLDVERNRVEGLLWLAGLRIDETA